MTPRTAAKYGYRLISMPYSIDGVTYYPYKDTDEEFDFHGYYEKLRDGVQIKVTDALDTSDMEVCPECGMLNPKGSPYCLDCGAEIG